MIEILEDNPVKAVVVADNEDVIQLLGVCASLEEAVGKALLYLDQQIGSWKAEKSPDKLLNYPTPTISALQELECDTGYMLEIKGCDERSDMKYLGKEKVYILFNEGGDLNAGHQ